METKSVQKTVTQSVPSESDAKAAPLLSGWTECARCGRHHLAACFCEADEAPAPARTGEPR